MVSFIVSSLPVRVTLYHSASSVLLIVNCFFSFSLNFSAVIQLEFVAASSAVSSVTVSEDSFSAEALSSEKLYSSELSG